MMVIRSTESSFPVIILDKRIINEPAVVLFGYIALAILSSLASRTTLQVWLAIVLGVLGSGSSTVAVLFPRSHDLDVVERIALGACLSMTVGGLLGFALARSPWGLHLWPILITAGLYNIICCILTWYRRRNLGKDEMTIRLDSGKLLPLLKADRNILSRLINASLVILLLSGAWMLAQNLRLPSMDPPMTEFYLLGQGGQTESYPKTGQPGEILDVSYGIVNRENETASYQIIVDIQGEEIGKSQHVQLASNEMRTSKIEFRIPNSATGLTKIEYVLYCEGKPCRFLHLWIDILNR